MSTMAWSRRRRGGVLRTAVPCVLGLFVAAAFLWLFSPFVVPAGAAWEHAWLLAIHHAAGRQVRLLAGGITQFGYPWPIAAIALVLVVAWLLRGSGWKAAFLLIDIASLTILNYGVRPLFFHRARPDLFPHPAVAGSSYPSGHALFAVGYYGMIAYLLFVGTGRRARRIGWTLWLLFALALGASRLVLGVHWPTDVLAGYVAGALVLLWDAAAARRWRGPAERGRFTFD